MTAITNTGYMPPADAPDVEIIGAFDYGVQGGKAGVNSATWHVCPHCGACVLDMHGTFDNRRRHLAWHHGLTAHSGSEVPG